MAIDAERKTHAEDLSRSRMSDVELYQIAVTQFQTVVQLIWTRYAGFLVLHGFIAGSLVAGTRSTGTEATPIGHLLGSDYILLAVVLLGMSVGAMWHLLNYLGWLSQNYHLRTAANLAVVGEDRKFFTDHYAGDLKKPSGLVYMVAQVPPLLLMAFYGTAFGYVLKYLLNTLYAIGLGCAVFFGALVILVFLEKSEFKRRLKDSTKPS